MRLVFCGAMIFMLLSAPGRCTQSARQALAVWGLDVVPSLFPYMVLCRITSASLLRTRLPASLCAAVLGAVGGSPSGAAALSVCRHEGQLSSPAFRALCTFCGCISPMFLLGTLQNWGFTKDMCLRVFSIHIAGTSAAALLVFLFSHRLNSAAAAPAAVKAAQTEDPISMSIRSVLCVGGCIVFFSVAAEWLCMLLPASIPDAVRAMIHATLEMSGGIHRLLTLPLGERSRIILCSAAAGFGGFSILLQNHILLSDSGTGMPGLFVYSLIRCALCVLAAVILS